jgi:hypothetical protein
MFSRFALALGLTGALFLGIASVASADPSGSKNNFTFPATCDGTDVTFVLNNANGQGAGTEDNNTAEWAPAHVVGTNQIFHPTAFDLTFTFTPVNGEPESFVQDDMKANAKGSVICTIDSTQADPEGSFSIVGTATGYFTGH